MISPEEGPLSSSAYLRTINIAATTRAETLTTLSIYAMSASFFREPHRRTAARKAERTREAEPETLDSSDVARRMIP